MSRNNVFKLSGNMALGGQEHHQQNDFENIKSSLKLLKTKQSQKRTEAPLEPTVPSFSYPELLRRQLFLRFQPTTALQLQK